MLDDCLIEVDIVDRLHLLHDHDQPLQPHASVDMLPWQRRARAIRVLHELHEDVVPDLQIPPTVTTGCTLRCAAAMLRAAVEIDLRIGTIRPGSADGSPPVVIEPADTLVRNSDLIAPDAQCILIVRVHGWEETVSRDTEVLGQELPGPPKRFPLEIVSDGEVPQHEEKRAVALVADFVDVDGAKAFLNRDHALRGGLLQPHEVRGHLLHTGGREQDRGIVVRHERRRRHLAVTALCEERDEAASHLLAGYGRGHLQVTRHGSGEPHHYWYWQRVERQNSPGLPDQSRIVPDSGATGNATRTPSRRRWLARPWRTPHGPAQTFRPAGPRPPRRLRCAPNRRA